VLLSPRHLVDRFRHPRTRADDLAWLRARFWAHGGAAPSAQARALALRLLALKTELAKQFSSIDACRGCARGSSLPGGHWDGGRCCGTQTSVVFTPEEVRALAWAGVSASSLEPPRGDHAGCAFRAATGCSLAPEQRPTLCLIYLCDELRSELRSRPDWTRIHALRTELFDVFEELARLAGDTPERHRSPTSLVAF